MTYSLRKVFIAFLLIMTTINSLSSCRKEDIKILPVSDTRRGSILMDYSPLSKFFPYVFLNTDFQNFTTPFETKSKEQMLVNAGLHRYTVYNAKNIQELEMYPDSNDLSLFYPSNSVPKELFAYKDIVTVEENKTLDVQVRYLNKQFCLIDVILPTLKDGVCKVTCDYNGINLSSLKPIKGVLEYTMHYKARRPARLVIPRQGRGTRITLDYEVDTLSDKGSANNNNRIILSDRLEKIQYNWSDEYLKNVSLDYLTGATYTEVIPSWWEIEQYFNVTTQDYVK